MPYAQALIQAYKDFISLPWREGLSGPEKCLFLLYPPAEERHIRGQLEEFDSVTVGARHRWLLCDLTDVFPTWMSGHEYAQSYFEEPALLESAMDDFLDYTTQHLRATLNSDRADENTVVAVCGTASLFGFLRVSNLIHQVEDHVRGRLAVFFPGDYHDAQYGLLGIHHGWNYHAVPIKPSEMNLSC